jgi:thiol-disulfide isomerase/thioredoxin
MIKRRYWNLVAFAVFAFAWAVLSSQAIAADKLKLNEHLDYQSDSADGPLISGENMQAGQAPGKVNYVIIYAEGCYNSKRQARRTVNLYQKYRDRVNFVVVDLDQHASSAQAPLVSKYYKGYIPTVVVLDTKGAALYDRAGEEDENALAQLLDKALE